MGVPDQSEVTALLLAYRDGDREALARVVPLIYDELRRIAARQLARGGRERTLDTTALVHEAYLKLVDQTRVSFTDRHHFLALTARAMRQIVVDHARAKLAHKRGAGKAPVDVAALEVGFTTNAEEVLDVERAFEKLGALDERLVRVAECRLFAGFSEQETADALSLSLRTVQREWMRARGWLRQWLGSH